MPTTRVAQLKNKLRDAKPSICIERARLTTEFYRQCSVETPVMRRARLLSYLLEEMTIYIADDELIVGNHGAELRKTPIFPEYGTKWIVDEIDVFHSRGTDPWNINEDEKKELLDILSFWEGKGFCEMTLANLSEEGIEAEKAGVLSIGSRITSTGHVVPNYPKVLSLGLNGIIEEARAQIASFNTVGHEVLKKIDFLNAIIISCESVIKFAKRFSLMARELAESTDHLPRKKELETIAEICTNVPANPPQSFHEAIQFVWFLHLTMQLETNGHSIGLGRFDQYMYPYYKKDLEDGVIEDAECVELIQCLWMKITEIIKVRDSFNAQAFAGYPMWQNVAIGGQTADGMDATNDLSYLVLEATDGVQTTQPSVSFRHHDNIAPDFFKKALKMIQKGLATPAFFNDKLVIPLVLAKGATVKEARDWSIEGCVEPYVSGKSDGRPVVGYINTIKILELVLNNGVDPLTGKQLGPRTGELSVLKAFEDLMHAYTIQMKHFNKLMLDSYNIVGAMHATMMPALVSSAVVDDCIKKGLSLQEGGAKYSSSGCFITSLANTADSLAAIETIVFKEGKLSLEELNKILKDDFKDNENIRQLLLNKAPKYGNDNDLVDGIARRLVGMYADELEDYRDSRGGKYLLSILSQSFNVLQGKSVGATPDGRHAFAPLANNASPAAGRDVNGPTASVKSISKIDQMQALLGTLVNQKYDPAIVEGEKGLDILGGVITAYFDLMGEHVQINVVSRETLLDAQENPDNYKNLMVRVAGYSAYFVELDRTVQEDIINRTSQSSGLGC